jgi:hypothetical protein
METVTEIRNFLKRSLEKQALFDKLLSDLEFQAMFRQATRNDQVPRSE